jgi:hypothetical protein
MVPQTKQLQSSAYAATLDLKTAQHKNIEMTCKVANSFFIKLKKCFKLFSTFRLFNCIVRVREFQLSGIRVRKKAAD